MSNLVQIDQLDFAYTTGASAILKNISLGIQENEIISLLGPSGSGKSTLLNLIAGFLPIRTGSVLLEGSPIKKPDPGRGVVFQDLALFPWLTVQKNVEFGLKMQGIPKDKRQQQAIAALEMVGLVGYEDKPIHALSGGMKQRVALARTLVTEPKVLLMDEPFSALDAQTREKLQDELLNIHRKVNMTILLVTHSVDEAIYLSDRVVLLSNKGTIRSVDEIHLDQSHSRSSEKFNDYRHYFYNLLKEENEQEAVQ